MIKMKIKQTLITTILMVLLIGLVSAICIDVDDPTQPGNFQVSDSPYDSDGNVGLSWSAASDTPTQSDCPEVPPENLGVDFYEVYMGTYSGFPLNDTFKLNETSGLSFAVNGLTQGTTYYFKVRAVDHADNIGPAASASTTIGTAPSGGGGSSRRGGVHSGRDSPAERQSNRSGRTFSIPGIGTCPYLPAWPGPRDRHGSHGAFGCRC